MHAFLRTSAFVASVLITSTFAWSASPGYVDFGQFSPAAGQQFVEVELDGALLKLAAVVAEKENPEIGRLIRDLERVRVNVLGLNDQTRASTTERVNAVRQSLDQQGWKRVVTVKEHEGDDVAVFLKQGAEDAIEGIVVTVIGRSNEAVLVNIVGNVRIEQLAEIGERLDLAPLRELNIAKAH